MTSLLALATLDSEFIFALLFSVTHEEATVAERPGGESYVRLKDSELGSTRRFDHFDFGGGPVIFYLPPDLLGG